MADTESITVVGSARDDDERTVVERRDPLIGTLLDQRFHIVEKIAAGGFGAIYRASHVASRHEVAIKVLHPSHAADPNVVARFRREGATLARLRAPHTVRTYELGEAPDGTLFIVMELLRGHTLHERLERGAVPWREALAIARAVCTSLAEAHALGVVHRDLKPANIHLEQRGELDVVKVLDFGIAKIRRGSGLEDGAGDLTTAGQMIGTIDYMSPEQILGGACDGRSDIYTLGVVIYQMVAGRRPFADSVTPTSVLAALLTQTPAPLSTRTPVPPALDELVARCLQREPQARFASVIELIGAIDAVLAGSWDAASITRRIAAGSTPPPRLLELDEEATIADARGAQPPIRGAATPAPIADARAWQGDPRRPRIVEPPPREPKGAYGYPPSGPLGPSAPYDLGNAASRDATVRRAVWILVLLVGSLLGIAIATLLR